MGFTKCAPVLLLLTVVWGSLQNSCCQGLGTFGFDLHHRYSDTVKEILGLDGLPEKGSIDYYAAMARRDLLVRGRQLTDTSTPTPAPAASPTSLTFSGGNETKEIGTLHYAYVNVGTPSSKFLVALDTGSDLFWLPCDCISTYTCMSGQVTYSPENSSTSTLVPCNSSFCLGHEVGQQCSSLGACDYTISYGSGNASSSGFLVEDVLNLTPNEGQSKVVSARVPIGCGQNQTGVLLDSGSPKGLFGLSFSNISIPSVLAREGLTANSFSMCFGLDGAGRIVFGDTGSSGQGETPLNLNESYQFYNVTVSKVSVGIDALSVTFDAIFDSGTSWTYLSDPAYTTITESFNSQVTLTRYPSSDTPFEYCYLSESNNGFQNPTLDLTMIGGDRFSVTDPMVPFDLKDGNGEYVGSGYCLAVILTNDVNVIGQNFMTGYNMIFDRGNQVLGWEASNCGGRSKPTAGPTSSADSPISSPQNIIREAFASILLVFLVYLAI